MAETKYRVVYTDMDGLERVLNEWSEAGWSVVTIMQVPAIVSGGQLAVVFSK